MRSCLAVVSFLVATAAADAQTIHIVHGPSAPNLEVFAAQELAGQLEKLFDAKVTVSDKISGDAKHIILLGSPATNPHMKDLNWPKLSDQGHILRSVNKSASIVLLVGGGSPVATLWAAYELGHRFGIRSFVHGDVLPAHKPSLDFAGIDVVLEPNAKTRAWRVNDMAPVGMAAWALVDHKKLLGQLAKLKFNHVVVESEASVVGDMVFQGDPISVSGDTAGRTAFKGAVHFTNPDFSIAKTPQEIRQTKANLMKGIAAEAQRLGMTVSADAQASVSARGNLSVVPQLFARRLDKLARNADGFTLHDRLPGESSPSIYYLARACFDPKLTPEAACLDLITPLCGPQIAASVRKGFEGIEKATDIILDNDPNFGSPGQDIILKHYTDTPVPPWWKKVNDLYAGAMDDVYRGISGAREGSHARPVLLYHAKQLEYALGYMGCVEAVRLAGQAKAKKDLAAQREHLDKAIESLYDGVSALAEVARDQSDRGVIAVLNEYGYRPLRAELKKLKR